jgi:hypothetical protein
LEVAQHNKAEASREAHEAAAGQAQQVRHRVEKEDKKGK